MSELSEGYWYSYWYLYVEDMPVTRKPSIRSDVLPSRAGCSQRVARGIRKPFIRIMLLLIILDVFKESSFPVKSRGRRLEPERA